MGQKVTTGEKASIFHDQTTGITIVAGQVKELTTAQLNSKRIKSAIAGGHLRIVVEAKVDKNGKIEETFDKKVVKAKIDKAFADGLEPKKAKESFKLEELKFIASEYEVEVEAEDNKEDILAAIFEQLTTE